MHRRDFLKTATTAVLAGFLTACGKISETQKPSGKQTETHLSSLKYTVSPKALVQTESAPIQTRLTGEGTLFLDFGKAAFGTLLLPHPVASRRKTLVVHLGEKITADGRIDRNPPGSIRYCRIKHRYDNNQSPTRLVIPNDKNNTGPAAIKMPDHIGEIYPFRYAEIENGVDLDISSIRQMAVHYPFNDDASSFESSNPVLNAVWDLCKYSIKATSFCGVYVDGDRERIPYEADAYINQLSHYCVDQEDTLPRYTHEYLLQHPTWPTEWQFFSIFMAWQDHMYTSETRSLNEFYELLCRKTLINLARKDGLISTQSELCTREFEQTLNLHNPNYPFDHGLLDLVDWPPGSFSEGGQGERDNHEMLPVNSVVNAFHYQALILMARISGLVGNPRNQNYFARQAKLVKDSINSVFLNQRRGIYLDGEGSDHSSLHSNMFMLAFDLVPQKYRQSVLEFTKSRGMACSVYGAQFLLEGLYKNNQGDYALDLMAAEHDRSWWHMIQAGSTITTEAWDWKYKNNLDWNHAWGAAPANIIPRYLMGIRPIEPGFSKVLIQPQAGELEYAKIRIPTVRGAISARLEQAKDHTLVLDIEIPENVVPIVNLPNPGGQTPYLKIDARSVNVNPSPNGITISDIGPGSHRIEMAFH